MSNCLLSVETLEFNQTKKKRWTHEFSKSEGWPAAQHMGQQDIDVAASSLSKRQVRGQFVYFTIAWHLQFSHHPSLVRRGLLDWLTNYLQPTDPDPN